MKDRNNQEARDTWWGLACLAFSLVIPILYFSRTVHFSAIEVGGSIAIGIVSIMFMSLEAEK